MSVLLIPVAPFSQTKSRLSDYFTSDQLKELTVALFEDLGTILLDVDCFDKKIVYCNAPEILDLASDYDLIGIKEEIKTPPKVFDEVINDLNNIAIKIYKAKRAILSFLDLILISATNFYEINDLLKENQIVICPAVHSAGISVLGRNPPNVISSYFSDPDIPSLFALLNNAEKHGIKNIGIYDSFRAGFDVDILQDLLLGYQYLKIFNLTNKKVYKFLKRNLKHSFKKLNPNNNRTFKITKEVT
jgi:2-phospho-L-lactate guanylyltransferase (CobY/MobA/RfbA family)